MRPGLEGRTAIVIAAAALPPLAFTVTRGTAAPLLAAACIAAISIALAGLERALRAVPGVRSVSVATSLLTLYATGLVWHEVVEPGLTALAFVAGAVLVVAWIARAGHGGGDTIARGVTLGAALAASALLVEAAAGGPPSLARPALLDSLFSSRHGLLFWSPVVTAALAGLVLRAARGYRDGLGALNALAVLAFVNAALRPWWSGGFANARFLPALPLFALGLATLLDLLHATAHRRPLRVAALAGAVLVAWNLLFMAQYRAELVPRDDTFPFPAVAENSARLVAGWAGSPTAWPANWIFAAQRDLPAARYDVLGGQDVLADGPTLIDVGDPETEAAFLGEGWSVRHPCGASVCREVDGRAVVWLPVADRRGGDLRVRAQGSGTLRLTLNGQLLAEAALAPGFTEVGGTVGRDVFVRGPNELALEVAPGGQALVEAVHAVPIAEAR